MEYSTAKGVSNAQPHDMPEVHKYNGEQKKSVTKEGALYDSVKTKCKSRLLYQHSEDLWGWWVESGKGACVIPPSHQWIDPLDRKSIKQQILMT